QPTGQVVSHHADLIVGRLAEGLRERCHLGGAGPGPTDDGRCLDHPGELHTPSIHQATDGLLPTGSLLRRLVERSLRSQEVRAVAQHWLGLGRGVDDVAAAVDQVARTCPRHEVLDGDEVVAAERRSDTIPGTAATDCEMVSCWRTMAPGWMLLRTLARMVVVFRFSQSRVSMLHRISGTPSVRVLEFQAP